MSREVQDDFATKSQVKTKEAQDKGHFISEIVPVEPPNSVEINIDEFPKPSTCIDTLNKLRPAFQKDVSLVMSLVFLLFVSNIGNCNCGK